MTGALPAQPDQPSTVDLLARIERLERMAGIVKPDRIGPPCQQCAGSGLGSSITYRPDGTHTRIYTTGNQCWLCNGRGTQW